MREKPGRRRLARATLPSGERCFLKHYTPDARRHPLRERAKRLLRLTSGAREAATHRRLAARGVAVPEVLGRFGAGGGEEVVATRFLPGESLARALGRSAAERRRLLAAVGRLVGRLHAAGWVHRDLHADNVWITEAGPVLLDLQAALPSRARWLRRRDLGELDASLRRHASLADRLRLREAALGVGRPWSAAARRALRDGGVASIRRARAHVESRTRRCLRTGRLYARLEAEGSAGLRWRPEPAEAVREGLGGPDALRFGPVARAGSPARAGWVAGHGLRARGVPAPLPLAFVEGRDGSSALLLAPHRPLGGDEARGPEVLERVVDLAVALRRFHVDHGTLRAAALCRDADGRIALGALPDVRFPRRLDAAGRGRVDALVAEVARGSAASEVARRAAWVRYRTRVVLEGVPPPAALTPGPG